MPSSGLVPLIAIGGAWGAVLVVRGMRQRREMERMDRDLTTDLPYYAGLSNADKQRFRQRVSGILREKEFIGRGVEVTTAMRTLISATIAQLTFGLPEISLAHFTRIIIYPDKYRSRIGKTDHVGEVNVGFKAIVLSWKRFHEDHRISDDARNLGLHEMAHALWFENRIDNGEVNFLDPLAFRDWRALAQEEATRIHAGRSRLFRAYAGTNQEEFFAVAVEYFFEQPDLYRRELPALYERMSRMLNQDPAAALAARKVEDGRASVLG